MEFFLKIYYLNNFILVNYVWYCLCDLSLLVVLEMDFILILLNGCLWLDMIFFYLLECVWIC